MCNSSYLWNGNLFRYQNKIHQTGCRKRVNIQRQLKKANLDQQRKFIIDIFNPQTLFIENTQTGNIEKT